MRLQATRTSVTSTGGAGDALYRAAGSRPTVDFRFAKDKSLVDKVSGQSFLTFIRSSKGTYVDSDGLIKTTPVNLLLYSEQFNRGNWVKFNVSSVVDQTTAPDGTQTAEKLVENSSNDFHRFRQSITASITGTFSIYVKAGERNKFEMGTSDSTPIAVFDLSTESVTSGTGTIQSISNGWYRCSVNGTFTTNGPYFLLRDNTSEFYQGDGTSGLYVWGGQLEEGGLSNYILTGGVISGAPRFDHDPETLESLGLLIEKEQTNLLANSSGNSSTTYWGRASMSVPTLVDGPAGANTAYQYLSLGGFVSSRIQAAAASNYPPTVIGTQYTISCYIKPVNYDTVTFGGDAGGFGSNTRCLFNLSTGVINVTNATERASIKPSGNGWYRLEIVTIPATAADDIVLFLNLGTATDETHTTSEGFQVYGFQIEEGEFATSIIETTDAQATRAADNPSFGVGVFPWNNAEGTVVTTTSTTLKATGPQRAVWTGYINGLASNTYRHYILYRSNTTQAQVSSRYNSSDAFSPPYGGTVTFTDDVIAYGYSSSEPSDVFHDGSLITSTPGIVDWTIYDTDRVGLGGFASNKLNGHLARFTYFPTKRTDQELINVTGGDTAIPIITYGITSAGGTFNLRSTDTVDYAVDWDSTGGYETSTSNVLAHTYAAGDYELVIYSDDVYRPYFNNGSADASQITSVEISVGANLGTNLGSAWKNAGNLASFVCPFEATTSVTSISNTWRNSVLTSFPLIDTSSVTFAKLAWQSCNLLTTFPQLNFSICRNFGNAWRYCTNLSDFPANMFDTTGTLASDAFSNTWKEASLNAQSIENILVSLDTNGQSNISLGIQLGSNAAKTTWSTAANTAYDNLIAKGWSITYNA